MPKKIVPDALLVLTGFPVQTEHEDETHHRRLLAEAINRLAEDGPYVLKTGDQMTGDLRIVSNHLQLGQDYPLGFDFKDSAYLVLDSKTEMDDSSIVFRQGDGRGGAEIKWEMGKTTETSGSDPRFHLKRVTGLEGAETFVDIFVVEYADAEVWLPSPVAGNNDAKFGVNTIPLFPVHIAVDSGASRGLVVVESEDTSGSKSVGVNLKATTGVNWLLGTDFGLDGSDNFFIQGTANVALYIHDDTKVSVGTSEAQGTLHVRDSEDNDTRLSVRAAGSQAQNLLEIQNSSGTVQVLVDTSFHVRIGGASGPLWASGSGSPEGVVTAPVGSFFSRTDGGAGTSFYVKESGTGNTGWVAK